MFNIERNTIGFEATVWYTFYAMKKTIRDSSIVPLIHSTATNKIQFQNRKQEIYVVRVRSCTSQVNTSNRDAAP